jgi:diguanylate cyclase (GGDEF)-like protein
VVERDLVERHVVERDLVERHLVERDLVRGVLGVTMANWRSPSARLVALEVFMLALGTGFAAIASSRTTAARPELVIAVATLAIAFYVVELVPLHLEWAGQAYSLSMSEVPLVVGLLCWPSTLLIFARVVGGAAALVVHRRQPLHKLSYNVAVQYLEATVALAVFLYVPHAHGAPIVAAPAVLAAVVCSTGTAVVLVWLAIRVTVGHLDKAIVRSFTRSGVAGLVINPAIAITVVAAARDSHLDVIPLVIVLAGAGAVYRAYVSLRLRHASLETLYDFTRGISHGETMEGRLREVLLKTRDMLKSSVAGVVIDDEKPIIRWVDADGTMHSEPFQQTRADWAFSLVLTSGAVVRMPRASRDAGHQAFLQSRGIRDAMLAPLMIEGSARGVLFVQDRRSDVATFTEDDAKLFETVATHAASVLDNSRLVDRLRHESRHDALTGLMNRHYFRARLSDVLGYPGRHFALMIGDLDRFKDVNDTLGHHHGDLLIREVASRIAAAAPPDAVVARLGGDEFAVLVPAIDAMEARAIAQAIRLGVSAPCVLDGIAIDVDASFGIALAPDHGKDETVLLKRADMAMYAAKSSGTGIEIYDRDRDDYSPRRLALATDLRAGIDRDELVLHYQPQVDVDGTVTGVEALVRWHHPVYGEVSPGEFIGLAERSGAITQLTRWVLAKALEQLAAWHRQGLPVTMSVNVSMRNLLDAGIVDSVRRELRRMQVAPQMVTLEITESHIMSDPGRTLPILHRLASLGVRLSIDDFGTGYSSLSHLRQFPVHEIKIDRSFIGTISNNDNRAIVKAVIAIAEGLDVETVAEGVEDGETAAQVALMGCTRLQGYYIARPMPAEQVTEWLVGQHLALEATRSVS